MPREVKRRRIMPEGQGRRGFKEAVMNGAKLAVVNWEKNQTRSVGLLFRGSSERGDLHGTGVKRAMSRRKELVSTPLWQELGEGPVRNKTVIAVHVCSQTVLRNCS